MKNVPFKKEVIHEKFAIPEIGRRGSNLLAGHSWLPHSQRRGVGTHSKVSHGRRCLIEGPCHTFPILSPSHTMSSGLISHFIFRRDFSNSRLLFRVAADLIVPAKRGTPEDVQKMKVSRLVARDSSIFSSQRLSHVCARSQHFRCHLLIVDCGILHQNKK